MQDASVVFIGIISDFTELASGNPVVTKTCLGLGYLQEPCPVTKVGSLSSNVLHSSKSRQKSVSLLYEKYSQSTSLLHLSMQALRVLRE